MSTGSKYRSLSAIMFTDIEGYTSLMQNDEENAIKIREKHRSVLEKSISDYNGKILQFYGDGTLSTFSSAVEAVKCGIDIQKNFNTGQKIPVRVGIHLGDIVFQEDGIYGDGVNIASRVESLSISGAVLISDKVNDELGSHSEIETRSLGIYNLKNVSRPFEIFAIVDQNLNIPTAEQIRLKTGQVKKSIAVLPFVNMSADKENEYFSDGMTEEILNALAGVDGLQVTSRTSSFAFKNQNLDVRTIGEKLNVNTVVEGSVRKAGNKVRITAQLINTSDGYHIWSDVYDRDLEDVFAVQDEISSKIANTLRRKLDLKEAPADDSPAESRNLEAYELYLKGKFHWYRWTPHEVFKAKSFFERAIELEPNISEYNTAMSSVYTFLAAVGYLRSEVAYPKAMKYAERALELDDSNADSHLSIGMVKMFFNWDWKGAEEAFKKTLELNPGSSDGHQYYSMFLQIMRRDDEAIIQGKIAVELNPLSPLTNSMLGDAYRNAGRFAEAIEVYTKILQADPQYRHVLYAMGWAQWELGETEIAEKTFLKAQSLTKSDDKGLTQLGYIYAKTGREDKARDCLNKIIDRSKREKDTNLEVDLAIIYTGLGEFDHAFECLEKAFKEKHGGLLFIRSIHWKEIEKDPRMDDLLKRMKIKQEE